MSGFYANPCIFSAPSLSSAPDPNHPAPDSLEQLPFTNLLDVIDRANYPVNYRKRAAVAVKALRRKTLERHGGYEPAVASMDAMIARRIAESPAFAEIYGES